MKDEDILVESFYDRSQAPPSKYMKLTNPETLFTNHEHFAGTGSVISSNATSPVEEPIQAVGVECTTDSTKIPVAQEVNIPNVFALLAAYAAFLPSSEE
jgi:predicted aldo/keto reductase-like oxidoreductase